MRFQIKLWIKLAERDMNKSDLANTAGISSASIAKLGRCTNIATDILLRICKALKRDIPKIVEIITMIMPRSRTVLRFVISL